MRKILVADDVKNIRCLLTTCLEHEGFEVVSVGNGQEAIDAFQQDNFDLAFLDIKMPKVSGTEVLRQIRELGIHTPVIIITAFATIKNAVECTHLGAVAYLQKPFTTKRIKQILAETLHMDDQGISITSILELCKRKLSDGDFEGALLNLKKALSIDPRNEQIYRLLSQTYHHLGHTKDSKKFQEIYELLQN